MWGQATPDLSQVLASQGQGHGEYSAQVKAAAGAGGSLGPSKDYPSVEISLSQSVGSGRPWQPHRSCNSESI